MTDFLNDVNSLPGLSASHTWRDGVVVFGDNQGPLPRLKISKVAGLYAAPDSDDNRRRKFGQVGEYPVPAGIGGKTLVYTGVVQTNTLDELEYWANRLKQSQYTDPQLSEGKMVIARPAARAGGHSYRYMARLVQADCDDEQTTEGTAMPTPWQRPFVVSFRLSDPRIYVTDAQVQVESAPGAGNNDPFVDVANPGGYDSPPVLRITGPVVQPRVSIPGAVLAFGFTLAAGEWADVDFVARTVKKNDGSDLSLQRTVSASTWWDAGQPGIPGGVPAPTTTRVTLTSAAGHPGAGAKVRVTMLPAV